MARVFFAQNWTKDICANLQMYNSMEKELLKVNLLSIAAAGLLMLLAGAALYLFKENAAANMRYFLPIPPLGVAAYVFVFNLFRHYNGALPASKWAVFVEVLYSTTIVAAIFFVFTLLLVFGIDFLKRYL
jgi:hypothetical protein